MSSVTPISRRVFSPSWWLRDQRGKVVIVQFPNAALWVWILAGVVRWLDLLPGRETVVSDVGRGGLVAWALDELVRGANPMRRVLGLVVLVAELIGIAHR